MGIIAWIIFGLIAGAIAKLIMPGNDGGGFILTCVLGVVGAVVAFFFLFADPAIGPVGPQIFVFGAVFILAAFLVFGAIALFSGAFGNLLLRSLRAQFCLNKLTAVVFVGMSVNLATASL